MKNLVLLITLMVILGACSKQKKERLLFVEESTTPVEEITKQNPDLAQNADMIARTYYAQVNPDYKNENLTFSTHWENNQLSIEAVELLKDDAVLEAKKIILVFERPMGVLRIRQVLRAWKCKGETEFAAEPCQ